MKRFRLKNGRFCNFNEFVRETVSGHSYKDFLIGYRISPRSAYNNIEQDTKMYEKIRKLNDVFTRLGLHPKKTNMLDNEAGITVFDDGSYNINRLSHCSFNPAMDEIMSENKRLASIWNQTTY